MVSKKDKIYAEPKSPIPFNFDENVAEVFPDMIERSVPGYALIIDNIKKLAAEFVQADSNCYDLGCSLGAASLAMSQGITQPGVNIVGVDNSAAMLDKCRIHINAFKHQTPIHLVESDIQSIEITNASMAVLNFTLQFIAKEERAALLRKIADGLNPGGMLLLSEKVCFDDPAIDNLMINLHHQFKRENGYSDLEISQKRNALENVLLPETLEKHKTRLKSVGFRHVSCWLRQYNFVSIVAIK